MSLFDDASLAMIPSAYKDGKLYSIKPTDGSGDFTFTRGSNLAATRVDENGLIEKGRENLLLQSNNFTTNWGASNASVTSGQSGYDGTNDAWLLDSSSEGYIFQYPTTAAVGTLSIYAKANSVNNLRLRTFGASINAEGFFDLANGVVGSSTNLVDLSIESVSGGWYRCSVVCDNAPSLIRIYPSVSSSSSSGTIGSIYIQDAQLELGLVATDYIETTTTTAQAGILEDMPRLDYSGGASCPSLLLEPQRTNDTDFSEYFNASYWTKSDATIVNNVTISPEGVQNASKIVESSSTSSHRIYEGTTGSSSIFSFYAKAAERTWVSVLSNSGGFSYFDIGNGVLGTIQSSSVGTIESVGSGWYRCTLYNGHGTYGNYIGLASANNTSSYTGDGTSGVYIWGAQLESNASYHTSYIPTYGTSQTRLAEDLSLTSAAVATIAPISGITMFIDFDLSQNQQTARFAAFNDAYSNYIFLGTQDTASNQSVRCDVRGGGVTFLSYNPTFTNVGRHKIAVKFLTSGIKIYLDGVEVASSGANAGFSEAFQKIVIGRDYPPNAGAFAASNTNSLIIFPTALTDSECIALTTL
jgi:hypothetical protein